MAAQSESTGGTCEPSFEPTQEQVRLLFRQHDLRCTRQRELVYTALARTKQHPTAEDLYRTVHEVDPGLSLATVYNTLEALVACGLGRRLSSGGGPCHYDADMDPHVHVSLADGRLIDVPQDLSERLLAGLNQDLVREIERRMGVSVRGVGVSLSAEPRE
jgi:Fur family peroxide stress response transcriptional regulator